MNLEMIPLLLVALLWMGVDAADVDSAELLLAGQHDVVDDRGAMIVGDAQVTVPADVEVPGPIYVIGGETYIHGQVGGDVVQLAGELQLASTAGVGGELQHVAGVQTVADGAAIAERRTFQPAVADAGPVASYGPVVALTVALALLGAHRTRRRAESLATIGAAVAEHPVVSLTVGALTAATFTALFVFMAFTLILLPVAIAGLAAGLVALAYAVVALGALVGQRLRVRLGVGRAGLATAGGVVAVMAALQLLQAVPVVGTAVGLGVLLTGLGAVLVTYFGLQRFQPAALPD